jgi:hypothetical protein
MPCGCTTADPCNVHLHRDSAASTADHVGLTFGEPERITRVSQKYPVYAAQDDQDRFGSWFAIYGEDLFEQWLERIN